MVLEAIDWGWAGLSYDPFKLAEIRGLLFRHERTSQMHEPFPPVKRSKPTRHRIQPHAATQPPEVLSRTRTRTHARPGLRRADSQPRESRIGIR